MRLHKAFDHTLIHILHLKIQSYEHNNIPPLLLISSFFSLSHHLSPLLLLQVSLSLVAPIAMDFRHPNGAHQALFLPPRSLLVLGGEARYAWTHGIAPRKSDVGPTGELIERTRRVSLTYRKIRHTPCDCSFSAQVLIIYLQCVFV